MVPVPLYCILNTTQEEESGRSTKSGRMMIASASKLFPKLKVLNIFKKCTKYSISKSKCKWY